MTFEVDWLPDEVNEQLNGVLGKHGPASMERVRRFLDNPNDAAIRFPYQKTNALAITGVKYVLPEISKRGWQDLYSFEVLGKAIKELEARSAPIRAEYESVTGKKTVLAHAHIPDLAETPYSEGWKYIYLHRHGAPTPEAKHFPITASTIHEVMGPHLYSMTLLHFAVLEPGTHIAAHCDVSNLTVTVHLGLDIPEKCRIRCEDEWRTWHEGKCLGFDHSFEHEAINEGSRPRICLLMDVWNPNITMPEREALALIFRSIHEAYSTS